MTQHTEGPWTYAYGAVYDIHESRLLLADRNNPNTSPCERDRNVQLAAAAPELLGALEALYKHCSMIHNVWGEGCNRKEANAAIQAGRDAITKAKEG